MRLRTSGVGTDRNAIWGQWDDERSAWRTDLWGRDDDGISVRHRNGDTFQAGHRNWANQPQWDDDGKPTNNARNRTSALTERARRWNTTAGPIRRNHSAAS